jgi:hypothetical protein
VALLGIYPKEMKSACQRDTCTPMVIAARFTGVHQQIMDKENVIYIHNGVLFSHKEE